MPPRIPPKAQNKTVIEPDAIPCTPPSTRSKVALDESPAEPLVLQAMKPVDTTQERTRTTTPGPTPYLVTTAI